MLNVCLRDGAVRIGLGYIVEDYCLTFVGGGAVRIVLGYIVDDYCLTFVRGRGGGSYYSWLYCGRLLLDVCRRRGVVRIALGYMVDDYCLRLIGGGGWFVLLLVILWTIIA